MSNSNNLLTTTNQNLQTQLSNWCRMIEEALTFQSQSVQRSNAILSFCKEFCPIDVTEDDISHFAGNLFEDEEFFQSLYRELCQCENGDRVESITGNQKSHATFTLLPAIGTLSSESTLDIVREVSFISHDDGIIWRAEG
eukprot:gene5276-7329_t